MCPRSLELSSSYTTNHDDELKSLFLSGNQESVFMADSIDDRSSGFTPDDGRGSSWVAINFQFISSRFDLFPEWIKLQFCSYAEVFVGNAPYLYSLHCGFSIWQKVSCLKWIRLSWISFACCQFPTFLSFFSFRLKEKWKWPKFWKISFSFDQRWKNGSTFLCLNCHTTAHKSTLIPSSFLPQRQYK